jgi:nucleoside-triphosphatase THEP1
MNIAYTMAPGRGDTDLLLFGLAETLAAQGVKCCGTVQINTECANGPCDMDVKVLPNGPTMRISQSLGTASKGCRLDPSALENAVGLVSGQLTKGADLLIVNKFGKHEADGRGFRSVIAEAIAQDVPVLIGVNPLNLSALEGFVGVDAVQLSPSVDTIHAWYSDLHTAIRATG